MKKCKMIVFSDLHYSPERPINNGSKTERKLIQYALPLLEQLIEKINNEINPDIVINLGDLIEDFKNHDKNISNLKFVWKMLKNIKPTFYSVPGNHDLRSMNSRTEVEEIMGYQHSTFSVNILGYHFVLLGLDVKLELGEKEGGIFKTQYISEEDIEWLKKDLEENNLPTLVFNHFGIAEDNMHGNWWFKEENSCPELALLRNRKEVKEILQKDKNIIAVFSGHQHWTKQIKEEGINYYLLGSLTEDINSNGIPDGVYYEVILEENNIEVIEKHLSIDIK